MPASTHAGAADQLQSATTGAPPVRPQREIMPSSRHSVLAKAALYRSEPERVNILIPEPLVAVVHGLHADHTVRQRAELLTCSCERFRRGEGLCAHVLAVEHRRSSAASDAMAAHFSTARAEFRSAKVYVQDAMSTSVIVVSPDEPAARAADLLLHTGTSASRQAVLDCAS